MTPPSSSSSQAGGSTRPGSAATRAACVSLARAIAPPRITRKPIPYGPSGARRWRDYAQRHYGIDDYRLRDPKVIVEHYTVTDTFAPVFNYFSVNEPDPELHELPGVCSHYVIDRDGTIYELVPPRIMCRHTVGLNYTAIGIEHVGQSDAQVMGNPRQRAASLRLTRCSAGPLRDNDPQRDRPQREPVEPVPPRARGEPAQPDARRLPEAGDGRVPALARAAAAPASLR